MQELLELINEIGPPLIAFVVPFVVAGIRGLIPAIPKAMLPVIAGAMGPLGDSIVATLQGIDASPVAAALFGLAGVGVREVFDQVMKSIKPPENIGSFILIIGMAGMLVGCGGGLSLSGPQIEAQTPQQEAYALQQNYDAFLDTVENLVDNGVLTGQRAEQAADIVEAAGVAYRSARDAVLTGAPNKLQMVIGFQQVLLRLNPLIAGDEQ